MNEFDCDYADELDTLCRLAELLLKLHEILERNPVKYPDAIRAYNTVLFGLLPIIRTKCEHSPNGECEINMSQPVGGITDALECIEEAISVLELEVIYEYEGGVTDGV